jgi:hypothetical protein
VPKYFTYPISILSGNFKPRENFILANGKRKKEQHNLIPALMYTHFSIDVYTSMLE